MKQTHLLRWCRIAGATAAVALMTTAPTLAQSKSPAAKAPRTAWGAPDLQGVWSGATVTPLERPDGQPEFLTAEQVADIEKAAYIRATDEARGETQQSDVTGAYNDFWWDRGTKVGVKHRSSLIFDPADGKLPALVPEMAKLAASEGEKRRLATRRGEFPAASWLDTDLWDRCLTRSLPIVPGPYNNNYQIIQTPTHVVILHEMIHDARVIPISNTPHVSSDIRLWAGDPRAHWEGDTLVIESTNFYKEQEYPFTPRTPAGNMKLVERLTRAGEGTLLYEFTVEDPSTYTRPWKAEIAMPKGDGQLYEYACHEGNYGMFGILGGSRETERRAAEAAKKGSR
jgi:hypothetical protein